MEETKYCKECGQDKPVPECFYEDSRAKDGYYSICKECFNKRRKKYRERKKMEKQRKQEKQE